MPDLVQLLMPRHWQLQQKLANKSSLRCFNRLSHDLEVNPAQVVNTLLELPSYNPLNYDFNLINPWWPRRYLRDIAKPSSLGAILHLTQLRKNDISTTARRLHENTPG